MFKNLFLAGLLSFGVVGSTLIDTPQNDLILDTNFNYSDSGLVSSNYYVYEVDNSFNMVRVDSFTTSSESYDIIFNDYLNNDMFVSRLYYYTNNINRFTYQFSFFLKKPSTTVFNNLSLNSTFYLDGSTSSIFIEYYLNKYSYFLDSNILRTEDFQFTYSNYYNLNNFDYFVFDLPSISFTVPLDTADFNFTAYKYNDDYFNGYTDGYTNGYNSCNNSNNNNTYSFLDLFTSIADTPIIFLHGLFNFDLFGISMFAIFGSLLTGIIILFVIKKFL